MISKQKFIDINKVLFSYIGIPIDKIEKDEMKQIELSLKLIRLCSPNQYTYAFVAEHFLRSIQRRLQLYEKKRNKIF